MSEIENHYKFGGALRAGQVVWIHPAIEITYLRRKRLVNFVRRVLGV